MSVDMDKLWTFSDSDSRIEPLAFLIALQTSFKSLWGEPLLECLRVDVVHRDL